LLEQVLLFRKRIHHITVRSFHQRISS